MEVGGVSVVQLVRILRARLNLSLNQLRPARWDIKSILAADPNSPQVYNWLKRTLTVMLMINLVPLVLYQRLACQSTHLFVSSSIHPSICPSIHPFIHSFVQHLSSPQVRFVQL
jgi:hypothetical protein